MKVDHIKAIDVHAHIGIYSRGISKLLDNFMSGDAETILDRAQKAQTELTIVSSLRALLPRGKGDPVEGNDEIAGLVATSPALRFWVVIDPREHRTYDQAHQMLSLPSCAGIKIHPEEHEYRITDYGRAIFEFAARQKAVVITHSGEQNSMPEDFVPLADDFPEVTLILAHHGCGWDNDPTHQVRAIQHSRHGNILTDTSSASNITPGQIEWAVKEAGAEKILYGTDSPLYFAPMQRARIDHACISDREKTMILRQNAVNLLGL